MATFSTTREEYKAQHYEGAFTQFGPWTLATYRIVYHGDAKSLGGTITPISGTSPTFVVVN